jgi:hypothetical protein
VKDNIDLKKKRRIKHKSCIYLSERTGADEPE